MTTHPLDRPAWSALSGPHASLAEGGERARRYRAGTVPFAAAADTTPESLAALAALPAPGEVMAIVEANELTLPPGMECVRTGTVTQMILDRVPEATDRDGIDKLGWQDAEEMLALGTLTQPGPFTLKAQALGDFYGIRRNGRIVAMAGHRMRQHGFFELSGVCAHPDVRGQGLGRKLSLFVTHLILARGDTPYLHAWADNTPAITLYASIGYVPRATMNFAAVQRAA